MNEPDRYGLRLAAPLVLALCAAVALLMLTALREEPELTAPSVRFSVLGTDGLRMEELRGRPVLVNFWATTCPVCRHEMPHLADLYRELHPRGLELIGVAMPYDPPNLVAAYARQASIPYPVALDIDAGVTAAFGGVGVTPTTFLIGPDGGILQRREGRLDFNALRRQILELIPAAAPNRPGNGEAAPAGATAQVAGL
jgi:thiol-disulfide isomerase/thioredoxin